MHISEAIMVSIVFNFLSRVQGRFYLPLLITFGFISGSYSASAQTFTVPATSTTGSYVIVWSTVFPTNIIEEYQNSSWVTVGGGAQSGSFTITKNVSGTYTYRLKPCTTGQSGLSCSAPLGPKSIVVTLTPPPSVNVSFNPNPVDYGQNSLLTWSSTGATSCSGSPTSATSGSMLYPITTTTDWSYTVTCTGAGGTTSATAVLKVNLKVPTVTASFNPSAVASGASTTLTWSSTDAASCTVDGVAKATSGSQTYNPTSTKTVPVVCTGVGGSASTNATVTVPPVPTDSASFNPSTVASGAATTLTWSSTNATSCTVDGVAKATSGSQTYNPTSTQTVSVVCTGVGGSASTSPTVTVTQGAAPVSIITSYEYDEIGRVTVVKRGSAATDTYKYDAADNRTQKKSTN
jgi:YD repeat-containing protein